MFCPHTRFFLHIFLVIWPILIYPFVFLYILVPEHRSHLEPKGAYIEDRILQRRERRLASPGKLHSAFHVHFPSRAFLPFDRAKISPLYIDK